jgi:putative two-component system response regulator
MGVMVKADGAPDRVLVVDDDPLVASLLRQQLSEEGYEVVLACNGREALAAVGACPADLVLLDVDMPLLSGDEVCRRLKADPLTRLIPVVMITSQGAFRNRLAAWDYGADEFLPKPFLREEVTTRCRSLLRVKRLVEERDSAEAVVFALARAVEAKNRYTHGHSERTAGFALALARALGLPGPDLEVLHKGGRLHDVGKISIPDAVLDKQGPLTAEEYELVKDHAAAGAHILEPLQTLRAVVPLVRHHHERLDGHGYPDGLSGDEVPLLVRVLAVADVFDSLASDRPYRPAIPHDLCLSILRDNAAGGGLDPKLVALFSAAVAPTAEAAARAWREALAFPRNGTPAQAPAARPAGVS